MNIPHRISRVIIERITPQVDGGKFPIKRVIGERVHVEADAFTDGHDHISVRLLHRHESDPEWTETPMTALGNDRWSAPFSVDRLGRYCYTVRAQVDRFGTWEHNTLAKARAGQDVSVDLAIGEELIRQTASGVSRADAQFLIASAKALSMVDGLAALGDWLLDKRLVSLMESRVDEASSTVHEPEIGVVVDDPKARFSSWYELFPRSLGTKGKHGTFKDVEAHLPRIAGMGFDVLYLPPIHPIGTTFRKGKNNVVEAGRDDVGSPWAIGGPEGGHKSIHPKLGTLAGFRRLVKAAKKRDINIALDIAFQCSPDHPYVTENPQWFKHRPDGTIQYAENPPKKYQDIYPLDFECEDWRALWDELRSVFLFWIEQGVTIFRVDNPHTKPFPFWEWLITTVKEQHPEVIFLAEAFTRPKIMHRLAKL
ncbi:MAG: maltotransferase domain-containing protein, partial [Dehalococcoidia bacterium]